MVVVVGATLNGTPDFTAPTILSTVAVVPTPPVIKTGVISTESFRLMVVAVAVKLVIDGATLDELPPQEVRARSDNRQADCVRKRNT